MTHSFEADRKGRILQVPLLALHAGRDGEHAFWETRGNFLFVDQKRYAFIRSGLIFDGASVPKLILPLLHCNSRDLLIPSIPHDGGYRIDQVLLDRRTSLPYAVDDDDDLRYQWDKIFKKCCALYNLRASDCAKAFYGVRVGGSSSFHQKHTGWRPGEALIDSTLSLHPLAELLADSDAHPSPGEADREKGDHSDDNE